MLRFLITDDHPVFRKGLATFLTDEADFDAIVDVLTADEAASLYQKLQPDFVMMDLQMLGVSGSRFWC